MTTWIDSTFVRSQKWSLPHFSALQRTKLCPISNSKWTALTYYEIHANFDAFFLRVLWQINFCIVWQRIWAAHWPENSSEMVLIQGNQLRIHLSTEGRTFLARPQFFFTSKWICRRSKTDFKYQTNNLRHMTNFVSCFWFSLYRVLYEITGSPLFNISCEDSKDCGVGLRIQE